MPVGQLWSELMLDGRPFRKSLGIAAREASTWAGRVKGEFAKAFGDQFGGRKGFGSLKRGTGEVAAEMSRMANSAATLQAAFNLPSSQLLALEETAKATGIEFATLVKHLDEASKLFPQLAVGSAFVSEAGLNAVTAWGRLGSNLKSYAAAKLTNLVERFTPQSMIDEERLLRARERRTARIIKEREALREEEERLKKALPGQLREKASTVLERARAIAPGTLQAGPLARIGGFTQGAQLAALSQGAQQLSVLKLIERHTAYMAEATRIDPSYP